MTFTEKRITAILLERYGVKSLASKLPGELDLNFHITADTGQQFVFKIANEQESLDNLVFQHAIINHLVLHNFGLTVSEVIRSIAGEEIIQLSDGKGKNRWARLLTWVDGRVLAKVNPHTPQLLNRLGEMCGKLCLSLADFSHPTAHRVMKWDPSQAAWTKKHLHGFNGEQRAIAEYFYSLFENIALPLFPQLRMSVNYNDANDYNVLVTDSIVNPEVPGVIDFGDAVYTHTINELAIAIAYAAMDKPDPLEAACQVVQGFNTKLKLTEAELAVLFPLIGARLLISVVCSQLNRTEDPENVYLQISDAPAWSLLKKLKLINPSLAESAFRHTCGTTPHKNRDRFERWVGSYHKTTCFPVAVGSSIDWLDLSVGSLELGNMHEIADASALDTRITSLIKQRKNEVVLGKYDEARAIYATPAYEIKSNEGPAWRTIHLGVDFFCSAGTKIRAALSGTIHSFANNLADRDYGPTIILEHHVADDLTFYTLYGHLSVKSLEGLSIGKKIKGGEVIGEVGLRPENGNWTPHLHFQVTLDMLDLYGDFPGVCAPNQVDVWKSLCPDPWLLLTGRKSPSVNGLSSEGIVAFRKQHLGRNLSLSYTRPIKMVRGAGSYLIDDTGRRYLDTVNNVAHVGHEHHRVVLAGQRQMAVLNTNTRYLHDNIVLFVEKLLRTMPDRLNVAFVVNSGSEANELAIRLAKNYTGQRDMIVSEVGYHGNTNACIDISSYKFDGPGGKGRRPHVHVIPIPDTYRGMYRKDDVHAGSNYAGHVKKAIELMCTENRKPAALIFESVISCGGQVELPENFLAQAYEFTRAAGGVCIADEVQTGCGRAGDHFWAFQQHGVVPDIVTIGKPIGNGHPLGVVVTTPEIADAFKNGMEYFNTFGGNPVSCAIGLEVLRVVDDENLQQNAKTVGTYLKNGLTSLASEFEIMGDVRGPGLFIGFEFVKNRISKEPATQQASYFANRMRENGILMSTDGPFNNVMKIKPPMVFSISDSDFLLETTRKILKEDVMRSHA